MKPSCGMLIYPRITNGWLPDGTKRELIRRRTNAFEGKSTLLLGRFQRLLQGIHRQYGRMAARRWESVDRGGYLGGCNSRGIFHGLAFHQFRQCGTASDGSRAAASFKPRVGDRAI